MIGMNMTVILIHMVRLTNPSVKGKFKSLRLAVFWSSASAFPPLRVFFNNADMGLWTRYCTYVTNKKIDGNIIGIIIQPPSGKEAFQSW
jgi:hypothetical protein